MDLVGQIMNGMGGKLTETLAGQGFSAEQAGAFLPEALKGITSGLGKVDAAALVDADAETQVATLGSRIDLGPLAGLLGGNGALAQQGLAALIPQVMGFLKQNEGLGSLLGLLGGSGGGLAGMAKGLFN